jgi:hypothetical protein
MGLSTGAIIGIVAAIGIAIAVGSGALKKLNQPNEYEERDTSTDIDRQGGTRKNRQRKHKSRRR